VDPFLLLSVKSFLMNKISPEVNEWIGVNFLRHGLDFVGDTIASSSFFLPHNGFPIRKP